MSEIIAGVVAGIKLQMAEDVEAEGNKLGILRGGTIGLFQDGDFTGECPRKALLRMHGVYQEIPFDKKLMFLAGETNELSWIAAIKKGRPGWEMLTQEECGVTHKLTQSDVVVTGRPDIVIKGKFGIELKLICSLWTARDILNGDAKLTNMCQTVFYSLCHNLPFELWYTNRSNFAVTGDWAKKLLPKKGAPLSKYCDYNPSTGDIKAVNPFKLGFQFVWDAKNVVHFNQIDEEGNEICGFRESIISKNSLLDYYEEVAKHYKSDRLPKKPLSLDIFGEKQNYTQCQYCDLQTYCTKFQGKSTSEWIDKIPQDLNFKRIGE